MPCKRGCNEAGLRLLAQQFGLRAPTSSTAGRAGPPPRQSRRKKDEAGRLGVLLELGPDPRRGG